MDLVAAAHPYYQRRLRELGLVRGDFRAVADLARLPSIDKATYAADPEAFVLRLAEADGHAASVEERTRWRVVYTTGTTGAPTPFYDTTHDHLARVHQMTRAARIAGLAEADVVLNLFPLTAVPHQGFLSGTLGPLGVGARLVAGLGGRPYPDLPVHRSLDDIIDLAVRQRVTVLWGVATFTRRLIVRAEERGADLASVRLVLAMGEACPPGMRDDMRRRLGALGAPGVRVLSGYGFTEMQGPAMECEEGAGFHIPTPGDYHFEILDPAEDRAVAPGERGVVAMSHLNRRGTVLLRYRTGDISALSTERCPACGRAEPRFTLTPYRLAGLTKVKGTLVNPAALEAALATVTGLAEFQVVIAKAGGDAYGMDVVTVRVTCPVDGFEAVALEVRRQTLAVWEITPAVEPAPADLAQQIAQGYKQQRFVDLR
jgi:phenylacetate-coenzyme A ligase PaaK-like adenylate-forming protein